MADPTSKTEVTELLANIDPQGATNLFPGSSLKDVGQSTTDAGTLPSSTGAKAAGDTSAFDKPTPSASESPTSSDSTSGDISTDSASTSTTTSNAGSSTLESSYSVTGSQTSITAELPSATPNLDATGIAGINETTPVGSERPSGGLSAGAKGGIGAGTAVTVISLLVLIFFLMRRSKKRTRVSTASYDGYIGEGNSMSDLRKKEVGVAPTLMSSSSPTSTNKDDAIVSPLTRGGTNRSLHAPLNGNNMSSKTAAIVRDTELVMRKPVGVGNGEEPLRERHGSGNSVTAVPHSHVLDEDERARWEEEERRLDADIAEAERQRRLV